MDRRALVCCFVVVLGCRHRPPEPLRDEGPTLTSANLMADDGVPPPVLKVTAARSGTLTDSAAKGRTFAAFHGDSTRNGAMLTAELLARPTPRPPATPPPRGSGRASVNGSASNRIAVRGSGNHRFTISLQVILNEADAVSASPSTFTITGTLDHGGFPLATLASTFTVSPHPQGADSVDVVHDGVKRTYKANTVLDVRLDSLEERITSASNAKTPYVARVSVAGAGDADGRTHTKVTAVIHVRE